MGEDLHQAAKQVRSGLAEGGIDAIRKLTGFADEFAVTRTLYHRAVLLRRDFARVEDQGRRAGLRQQALELTWEIVGDHEAHADSEEARRRREAVERARSRLRAQEPPREMVFSCDSLGKTYHKSRFTLQGVSLRLCLGEITGVVGRNGNGKTTLFRLVAGDLRHDRGTLAYTNIHEAGGLELGWVRIKEQLAYVPQELPRWHGSLRNNLHYEAALHGLKGKANEREVEHIVQRLGLADELEKRWMALSGGFKLRFALAKALVWKPKLLLLDEPLANLDFKTQQILLRDIRDLASSFRYPMAVLISSQHLHEVEVVSDDIVFLHQGNVVYYGPMSGVGERRKYNVFELGASCDLTTLRRLLGDPSYLQVYFSGVSFVVRANLDVTADKLLRKLLESGVEIGYFRDISRSTKLLFEDEEG